MAKTMASPTLDPQSSVFAETLGLARSNQRLHGRKILIVGGGQRDVVDQHPPIGNGRAISVLCAREGASVVVLDANRDAAEATVAHIHRDHPSARAVAYQLDVRDAAGIVQAVAWAHQALGGLDGVVLVVGISKGLPLARMTAEAWDDDFAVNVRSHMLFAQHALPVLEPGSALLALSSLASITAGSGNPAYETSKAAQLGLVRAIAKAGEAQGIRCNGIAPGYVDTPMGRDASRRQRGRAAKVPFGRQATGWEVGYLAVFLLSHEASYVNGQTVFMDGGASVGLGRSPRPAEAKL